MTDIIGPGSTTPDVTTTRPADGRVMALLDTWFQDCSSSTAEDGTPIQAAWLNGVIAQLRTAIRGNGALAAGGPVITEDNSDTMLLAAILHLVQRGKMHIAIDSGSVNALIGALTPTPPELVDGMLVAIKPAVTNSGPSTLTLLGTHPIVGPDGNPIPGGVIIATLWTVMRWNAAIGSWQLAGSPRKQTWEVHYGVAGGAANALTTTLDPPITSEPDGIFMNVLPSLMNTTAATLAPNGLTAMPIVYPDGSPIVDGEILGSRPLQLLAIAGNLFLMNPRYGLRLPRLVFSQSSETYTPSSIASQLLAILTAAGAGAGYSPGGGGGAGATAIDLLSLIGVSSLALLIGSGGLGATSSTAATAGGNSSLGSVLSANGGAPGGIGTAYYRGLGGQISGMIGRFLIPGGNGGSGIVGLGGYGGPGGNSLFAQGGAVSNTITSGDNGVLGSGGSGNGLSGNGGEGGNGVFLGLEF